MADTDEMEISLLEGSEDCPNGHSSQDVLHVQTFLTGGIPHDGDPEMTGSGSLSPHPSKRKAKTRSSRLSERPSENKVNAKAQRHPSAELPAKLPMPKVDLKALFDYHFRRRQRMCRKNRMPPEQKEATTSKTPAWCPSVRPRFRISRKERMRRYFERGRRFPFAERFYRRKRIPFRMECLYEHAALKGFFKYIEQLKYEHHLKNSLTQLNAGDDLENECLELRKYKYLDDDGPLSPIEETEENQNENSGDKEDIGARIVYKHLYSRTRLIILMTSLQDLMEAAFVCRYDTIARNTESDWKRSSDLAHRRIFGVVATTFGNSDFFLKATSSFFQDKNSEFCLPNKVVGIMAQMKKTGLQL